MTVAFVVLAAVVVIALGFALADRVCLSLVERRASAYLGRPFGHPPSVRVHGTVFLTQALRGCYGDVEVSGGGLQIGDVAGATLNAHLYRVRLAPRGLLGDRAIALRCERVQGQLVLPYGELARASRIPGLSLAFDRDRLVASAALPVPGINTLARVSGEAVLSLAPTGGVWLRVRGLSVAGISLPSLVVNQLTPSLSVPIPLPPLPYGLRLDALTPVAAGLLVTCSAVGVAFSAAPPSQ